jgi:AbrB family looped-hinge helix DNA binding protein
MLMAARVKVSGKNQISLPSEVRKRLGIKSGDHLLLEVRDGHAILLREPEDYAAHMRGLHADVWQGIDPDEYVRREREAWRS